MDNFRLSLRYKLELRSSGMLHSVDRQVVTGVSGQLNCPSSRAKQVQLDFFTLEEMGPVGCPETSVTNRQTTLRNVPEE